MTLSLDTAYRSFGGEVEASSTPTICRLPDSRRHQLSAIARFKTKKPMWHDMRIGVSALLACSALKKFEIKIHRKAATPNKPSSYKYDTKVLCAYSEKRP